MVLELTGDDSSLGIALRLTDTIGYSDWLLFCKNSRTRVALLLSVIPVLVIALKLFVYIDLAFLKLC